MGKLVDIPSQRPGLHLDDALQEITELVTSGEVSSMVVALVYKDGTVGYRTSELPSVAMALGSLQNAVHQIIATWD